MNKYIDADSLKAKMRTRYDRLVEDNGYYDNYTQGYEDALCAVEAEHIVDAEKVRHSIWCFNGRIPEFYWCYSFKCAVCGRDAFVSREYDWNGALDKVVIDFPYCSKCGAKMVGAMRSLHNARRILSHEYTDCIEC